MPQNKIQNITNLVKQISDKEIISINKLAQSASYREYYRITFSDNESIIGTYNEDYKENVAFINFSKTFLAKKLNVANILAVDLDNSIYLLEDLGSFTLFDILNKERKSDKIPDKIIKLYKKSLKQLIDFQLIGNALDYGDAYPRQAFDEQSMFWDLNYFKYYFLKLAKIPFDEQLLENDFEHFSEHLLSYNTNFFMYRDFQARNIMVKNDNVYFIDFQGGRKGALQYDLASILFNSKANLPLSLRNNLLEFYYKELRTKIDYDKGIFDQGFYAYALIRLLQAMGAYGFRGFYEKKSYFLNSIPFALKNLAFIITKFDYLKNLPELAKVLNNILQNEKLKEYGEEKSEKLKIKITSFSYKKGLPVDTTEHGGGFVFDCRSIHNPGRYDQYKKLNGLDKAVIAFLDKEKEMDDFIENSFALVDKAVEKYLSRGFNYISVSYGCTGGQHRSVYSAQKLYNYLKEKYDVIVEVNHREQDILKLHRSC